MNPLKKAKNRIKVISLFGVSQILSILSVVLLSLVIVRFKSVELWGEYAEILIWSNLFLLFLSFGNNDYLLAVLAIPVTFIAAYNYYSEGYISLKFAFIIAIGFVIG